MSEFKIAMISAAEERIPAYCIEEIRTFADIKCKRCENPAELVDFASDCDILWMFGANIALKEEALDKMPEAKALFRSGSGLDALPLEYAEKHNLSVFNTPESISESVAEHAVALLFALARNVVQFDRQVHNGEWDSSANQTHWHLSGRTLGLIGYGRIAKTVEKLVSGFDMKVMHYDPFSNGSTPLDEMLKESDFVSVHCPLTAETENLINNEKFSLMKDGVLLVNTSRGQVVDEKALVEALQSGKVGGAALDVLCDEPPRSDNPLLHDKRVIITPHAAAFSADFEKNFWECSVKKLREICNVLIK
ncbi:MAG: hypothetical protein IKA22_11790 [Lentisphaeria bacterium]|nr:hypothetical protein [Lentisphaeria bacterium]